MKDADDVRYLVSELDTQISNLNERKYTLSLNDRRVKEALEEDSILFDPNRASKLFAEAGVHFEGQTKKDFEQLIDFNKAITSERQDSLKSELEDIRASLDKANAELTGLNKRRSNLMGSLSSGDVFERYRSLSADVIDLKAEIEILEYQRKAASRLQELRAELRTLAEERARLQTTIEEDIAECTSNVDGRFYAIRSHFNEIVEVVLDRKALLSVGVNAEGNLEFSADILDEQDKATSAAVGTTYKKLLCIAFDLAVLRAYAKDQFPKFVFHDGVFESLDHRKKENLLRILRQYSELGIQIIITVISSDLPPREDSAPPVFPDDEIALLLHDEGESGRLFKMDSW